MKASASAELPGAVFGAIHMHSDYSHDGRDSLEALRASCIERGIGFVGMTDHAEDLVAGSFATYTRKCAELSGNGFAMIPGLEFRFAGLKGLHLLALGLEEWIEPRTPAEFFEQARGRACMTILAHPVLAHHRIPEVVLDNVDAIEIWNGNYNTRYLPDPKSIRMVQKLRHRRPEVVATVGLDQHDSRNDRELRVVLPTASPDPLGELKAGRFENVGRTMRLDSSAVLSPARLGTLSAVRGVYDVVERAQDRALHMIQRFRGRAAAG
ncbi:MAG TPA: PHP domain-containing protein [Gemmatimonadaceae bacterium]|nr:PHP domain-containing protein [Gemmatimonadaceae bacterium]